MPTVREPNAYLLAAVDCSLLAQVYGWGSYAGDGEGRLGYLAGHGSLQWSGLQVGLGLQRIAVPKSTSQHPVVMEGMV